MACLYLSYLGYDFIFCGMLEDMNINPKVSIL